METEVASSQSIGHYPQGKAIDIMLLPNVHIFR